MKHNGIWNYFSGVISTILVFSLATSALAAYQKQAVLDYTSIQITLDGKSVIPTDANGNAVEPFAMDGTTYLPVRGIANALGLDVEWDQNTQTVKVSTTSTPTQDPVPAETPVPSGEYAPIGAPGVGVSMDTSILGGPLSATVNSADGVKLLWVAKNNSGKTINYYTLHLSFFNPVGDPAYDDITHESTKMIKTVGPVAPGGDLVCFSIVTYSAICSKIVIRDIDLEYSDGTKETIPYWFSTPEF